MAKVSKTARAAIQAGGNVVVVPKVTRTPEQMIREVIRLREADLFVSNMEYLDALIAEFQRLESIAMRAFNRGESAAYEEGG